MNNPVLSAQAQEFKERVNTCITNLIYLMDDSNYQDVKDAMVLINDLNFALSEK